MSNHTYNYPESELKLPDHGAWVRRGNVLVFEADETWNREDGNRVYTKPGPKAGPRPPCGTTAGYHAHIRHCEPTCRDCRDSLLRKKLGLTPREPVTPRQLKPCGTHAAYARHLKAKEKPCELCKASAREYRREKAPDLRKRLATKVGLEAKTVLLHGTIEEEKNGPGGAQTPPRPIHSLDLTKEGLDVKSTRTLTAPAAESLVA